MNKQKQSVEKVAQPVDESLPIHPEPIPQKQRSFPGASVILIIILSLLLGGAGMYIFQNRATLLPNLLSTLRSTNILPLGMNTYSDEKAGFSFQYPKSIGIDGVSKGTSGMVLSVQATPIDDIKERPFMSKDIALEEKEAFAKNTFPNTASWAIENKLVPIGSTNGSVSTLLSQFEVCSVMFYRSARFYNGPYMVEITLMGDENTIISALPAFFKKDAKNCGDQFMWNDESAPAFLDEVKRPGKTAGHEWYQTFDAIVQSIRLSTPQTVTASTPVVQSTITSIPLMSPKDCDVSDGGLCNVLSDIKGGVARNNWDAILAYEEESSITCDPDGMVLAVCEGQAKGTVKSGYMVGYIQSEGSMMIRSAYITQMKNYVTSNGPFVYKGTVMEGTKAIVVFLNKDESKALLFPLLKSGMTWRGTVTLVGNASEEYKTLSPAILEMM